MPPESDGELLLTIREMEILELVALGHSSKEVAQEINIAPRTVECHLDTMRLKMRARNRSHMVAIALRTKVLDSERLRPSPLPRSLPKMHRPDRDLQSGFARSTAIFER